MMFEHRKNDRYEYAGCILEYTLSPSSTDEIFEANVINFSPSGLCLLSVKYLAEGVEITIRNFMNFKLLSAKVIWVRRTAEGLFKIGLSFV